MNKVLIGLTTYNNFHYTKLTLDSLWRNTPKLRTGEARVVVIDNGSKDNTVDEITRNSFVDKIIVSDRDCISYQWNQFVDMLQEDEDFLIIPNDVVVGPNWLELLQEDTYKYDSVIVGSPYLPCDLQYDKVINQEWAEHYHKVYSEIRNASTSEELAFHLQILYGGDFDDFCLEFQERNKNEPPIDSCVTHVMLFKNKLFSQDKFRFCEEYCPVYGSMEFDMICELSNLGYHRIASSRSYVHHWVSASSDVSTNMTISKKKESIAKNDLHLLQKWEWLSGSTTFAGLESPSRIRNWRSPYHRWKKREHILSETEAKGLPGIKFMSFDGMTPGHSYFGWIKKGSIISWLDILGNRNAYIVTHSDPELLIASSGNLEVRMDKQLFNKINPNVDYYIREEEELYHGTGHMNFLLEKDK